MESNAFFKSIDRVAQYFFLFKDINLVRSDNASEVDTPFLKPYWALFITLFFSMKSKNLCFNTFSIILEKGDNKEIDL